MTFAPAALSFAQLVVLGVAIGAGAIVTWWIGQAVAWVAWTLFKLRRADIRARWVEGYRMLRRYARLTPPVAAWYATTNARALR